MNNGDMSSRTIQSATTNFSLNGNMLTSASGDESFNVYYDENGNIVDSKGPDSYTWNWDNKLRIGSVAGQSIDLKYDPMGNRIYKNSSETGERKYVVDIAGDLPVILIELDPNYNIMKSYIYANSQIIAQYDGSPFSANKYFYLHDRLGSVRQVIDCQADVMAQYTYNPFGELLTSDESQAPSNCFKFTGQWYDDEIGQYCLRARQYDPYLSRFTGRDPILGEFTEPLTLNKYLYCTNNSLNEIDPLGLDKYLVFDWFHMYVAVDVWEGDRLVGQKRYDFSAPHTWYFFMGLFLIEGEVISSDTNIDGEIANADSWLTFLVGKRKQSRKADELMKKVLDRLEDDPPLYQVGWNNCWNFAAILYLLDYEEPSK